MRTTKSRNLITVRSEFYQAMNSALAAASTVERAAKEDPKLFSGTLSCPRGCGGTIEYSARDGVVEYAECSTPGCFVVPKRERAAIA